MNNQNEQFEFLTRRTFFKKVSKKNPTHYRFNCNCKYPKYRSF